MATQKSTPQLKLKDLYQESQADKDQQDLQLELEQAGVQLKVDVLSTTKALSEAKQVYNQTLRTRPFNSSNIIAAKMEVDALEAGLAELKLLENLF